MVARIRPPVALAIIIPIFLGGLLFGILRPSSPPVLMFRGYRGSPTNSTQIAKLELRNTTSKTIWLYFSGEEFPLQGTFLEGQLEAVTKATNTTWTNITVRFTHEFCEGRRVLPGKSLLLELPLHPGQAARHVGIWYYGGTFADGNDFVNSQWLPLLNSNASWKETAAFYWGRLKRTFKGPKRHEVWCPVVLSFQSGSSSTRSE